MELSLLHRRESIIISTIETINEVGIQNLSTKLIAKREGVSEGTIFRHFKNKTEIMLAVIDHFSQFDDAIIATTINKKLNPLETIRYFMSTYSEYYENYPPITAIIQAYDILMCDPELCENVRTIITKRSSFLIKTIETAQEQGNIDNAINREILESLISGSFKDICLKWRMSKFNFSLKLRVMTMVEMILKGFTKEET